MKPIARQHLPILNAYENYIKMNDILHFLQQRSSVSRLEAPAPNAQELEQICQAACRAPDHAQLKPWRFLVIEGQGLDALGQLMAESLAKQNRGFSERKLADIAKKPHRAPMIIAVIAVTQDFPKVPVVEQLLTAGCVAHGILLAANALNYDGMWRTGSITSDATMREGLGVAEHEHIIGFLYVGSTQEPKKQQAPIDVQAYIGHWQGN